MTLLHFTSFMSTLPILFHGRILTISVIISFLLLSFPGKEAQAQPSPPNGPDNGLPNQNFSPTMGVIIIVLIAALFFMGFFSIYIRHCSQDTSAGGTRSRRIITGSIARSRRAPRGLDPAVIESFPTFDYAAVKTAKIGKGALECAVCLTEFEDDDTLRLIPRCDHVFHPECIDQWLAGHITCPVCRANLTEAGEWNINIHSPSVGNQNDTVLEVGEERHDDYSNSNINGNSNENEESESMEQPLHGRMRRNSSMVRNLSFGRRPRWMEKFSRSFSTGHVAVKQWESMDRFTLRLPAELRKQIVSGKLERSTSLVVLPRESSTRRGYRMGFGEGSTRGRSGSVRSDRSGQSERWVFSLAPPFITRAPSVKTTKVANATTSRAASLRGSIREGSLHGSVRANASQLPV